MTKEKFRSEVRDLVLEGIKILNAEVNEQTKTGQKKKEIAENTSESLRFDYQNWYTKALPVVRQLLPERYAEFQEQYKNEKRKEITHLTYTISDYLIGLRIRRGGENVVDVLVAFSAKFQQQITILRSALTRLDSILADIKTILQAEFFDDELSVAQELQKKGHLRAAGAIAGVTLERHLKSVTENHGITLRKADPTIAEFNEALKAAGVIDIPDWRFIQRLADIRNLCVHSKGREPTKDEVEELIRGAEKLVKTLS